MVIQCGYKITCDPPPLTIFAIENIFVRFMAMNFSDRGNFFSQLWNFQKLSQADGVGVGAIIHPQKIRKHQYSMIHYLEGPGTRLQTTKYFYHPYLNGG